MHVPLHCAIRYKNYFLSLAHCQFCYTGNDLSEFFMLSCFVLFEVFLVLRSHCRCFKIISALRLPSLALGLQGCFLVLNSVTEYWFLRVFISLPYARLSPPYPRLSLLRA